ncbi:MAG: DUF4190 domain-containing protein [Phycisphaerae bacterium]|nr:DUF4190 domain-containing protein [Phycisphaerae bacterium]
MTSTPPTPQPATSQPGRRKSARLSIAVLVMGIIALILGLGAFVPLKSMCLGVYLALAAVFLFGLPTVICGIIALTTKRSKKGLAIVGIVLSFLAIFALFFSGRILSRRAISQNNLHGLRHAITAYAAENNNQYPQQLSQLVKEKYITEKRLRYPGKEKLGVAYCYLAPAKDAPAETIIACEKAGFDFNEHGRNVLFANLFANRNLRWMASDEFAKALAKPHNAKFAKALKLAEKP